MIRASEGGGLLWVRGGRAARLLFEARQSDEVLAAGLESLT